jgi:capsular polysaccharide biosynthesis protein
MPTELRTFAHAIQHRFYLLIAIVAAFTVIAGVAAAVRAPAYRGTALLLVDERFDSSQGFNISLQAGQPLIDHFIQTASSPTVLKRACSGTYFDTPATGTVRCDGAALASHVSASAVKDSGWIEISVSADSAVKAAALANAVARAMTDQNSADIAQLLAPTRDYLNTEL